MDDGIHVMMSMGSSDYLIPGVCRAVRLFVQISKIRGVSENKDNKENRITFEILNLLLLSLFSRIFVEIAKGFLKKNP